MPHADPIKRKEYNDNYRKSEHGRARIMEGKKRYWAQIKADPSRLEKSRRKAREAMRLHRLRNQTEKDRGAIARRAAIARWSNRPQKQLKPIELDKKVWASARHKPLFVENERTIRRGRPKKKKFERPICDHNGGFKFKMTKVGMRRTCKLCGWKITEVAKR